MKDVIKTLKLPVIVDDCNLAVAQKPDVPFAIKRVYYIYNTKNNESRGFHAHRKTQQILFCLSGSVRVVVETKEGRSECFLNDPSEGVFLDSLAWHEMHDMDESTILLILASDEYNEADYIRDYQQFKEILSNEK